MNVKKSCADDSSFIGLQNSERHILLVDDNQGVVDVERLMLERLGYRVTPLSKSLKALEVFQSSPNNFDLVITDLSMPDLGGDQLIEKIFEIRSDIPIILCTGLNEEGKNIHQGIKSVLQKPVLMDQLSESITKSFDNTKDGPNNDYDEK